MLTVQIDLVDYPQQLCFGWIFTEWTKHLAELLGRDDAVSVLVERRERFTKLCKRLHYISLYDNDSDNDDDNDDDNNNN